jgi:hypothetical protein
VPLTGADPVALGNRIRADGEIDLWKYREDDMDESVRDGKIRVGRPAEVASESLEEISYYHRQYRRERGVDTLFLTLGFLEWMPDSDGELLRSPLFLLPVELERRPTTGAALHGYVVSDVGASLQFNPALGKKLETERTVNSPVDAELPVDELDDAFTELSSLVESFESWRVSRETTLGIFDFANISLYEDLERNRAVVTSDPLIRAIAGDPSALDGMHAETSGIQSTADDDSIDAHEGDQSTAKERESGFRFWKQIQPSGGRSTLHSLGPISCSRGHLAPARARRSPTSSPRNWVAESGSCSSARSRPR